jgi:hypothetical protein
MHRATTTQTEGAMAGIELNNRHRALGTPIRPVTAVENPA